MEFNKQAYKDRMARYTNELILLLLTKEIIWWKSDDGNQNVVFTRNDKTVKISHHSFYGYSRLACVLHEDDKHFVHPVEVTDQMWMENYITPIILLHFKS